MKQYRVYGHVVLTCSMVVEAASKGEAIEEANDDFGGLTNYAGMGNCDCLVEAVSEVEFDEAEEL